MNWGGLRNGKLLASVYLIAFPMTVIGLVLTLVAQWTGIESLAPSFGVLLFVVGALTLTTLSWLLRDLVPARTGGYATDRGRAWNRLVLGRELAAAWRVLKG